MGIALMTHPAMQADYFVGSDSELVDSLQYPDFIARLQDYQPGRVNSDVIAGGHHPWTNDLHLHSAAILHARSRPATKAV